MLLACAAFFCTLRPPLHDPVVDRFSTEWVIGQRHGEADRRRVISSNSIGTSHHDNRLLQRPLAPDVFNTDAACTWNMRKQVSFPVWKIIEIGAPLAEIYSANKYNVNRKKFCFFSVNWWIKDIPVPSLYERGIWLLRYRNFDPTLMTSYCLIPVPSGQDAHGSRVSPVLAFKVTLTTWNTIILMPKKNCQLKYC